MHADPTRNLRFAHALLEQARPLEASALELYTIKFDAGWMSQCRAL